MLNTRLLRFLIAAACAVVLIAALRASAELLNPVLVAGFLALLLQPLLYRLRVLRGAAVAIIVLAVVVVGLGLVAFLGVSLRQLAMELPQYQARFEALLGSVTSELSARGIDVFAYVEEIFTGEMIGGFAMSFIGSIAGGVGNIILTLFIFAFMLGGLWDAERRARDKAEDKSTFATRFLASAGKIRGYMAVRAVLGVAAAVLNYVLLLIVGVEYAGLWAVLSFLLSFVPNIGFLLSFIPPMLLALLEDGWISALIVFAGYQIINTVIDNIIGPRFIGRQMNISALVSFLSVIFWTWVLGPIGAILSVPLTVIVWDLASATEDDGATGREGEGTTGRGDDGAT